MAEYIEREALYQTMEHRYKYSSGADHKAYGIAIDDVLDAPAADVAPVVHGRWVANGIPDSILSGCSVCGFSCGAYSFRYCPNCGANMDLEG